MKFIIAINEAEEKDDGTKGTVTFDHVETNSYCKRTNRRKLHAYLEARGVPKKHVKSTMKALGFVDSELGITVKERNHLSQRREYLKTIKAA
jgi:hypothetical protein|tara:strand:+ start:788 stop:1063 length:276 start_codon:yes stop_codon:yes gene_type:complete